MSITLYPNHFNNMVIHKEAFNSMETGNGKYSSMSNRLSYFGQFFIPLLVGSLGT